MAEKREEQEQLERAGNVLGRGIGAVQNALSGVGEWLRDMATFLYRVMTDSDTPQWSKGLISALLVYLIVPTDLIPDFIPVLGQIDDAVAALLILDEAVDGIPREVLHRHWPGPEDGLDRLLGFAGFVTGWIPGRATLVKKFVRFFRPETGGVRNEGEDATGGGETKDGSTEDVTRGGAEREPESAESDGEQPASGGEKS